MHQVALKPNSVRATQLLKATLAWECVASTRVECSQLQADLKLAQAAHCCRKNLAGWQGWPIGIRRCMDIVQSTEDKQWTRNMMQWIEDKQKPVYTSDRRIRIEASFDITFSITWEAAHIIRHRSNIAIRSTPWPTAIETLSSSL